MPKVHKVIAEAAIKCPWKDGKVEVTLNVGSDIDLNAVARLVGTQLGVRVEVNPEARSAS